MNRLQTLFNSKPKNLLSVYFTAGFPELNDTLPVMKAIQEGGADIIEIGIPFSDPIADGPTIQASGKKALTNGMTLKLLFNQIESMRKKIDIPVLLMGYLNPVIQFGVENFAMKCKECGIDGLILPDMPLYEFETLYKEVFASHGLSSVFLVTPQTSDERIRQVDEATDSFIYLVSSSATTGAKSGLGSDQLEYFKKIEGMKLNSPTLIGFGISNRESFEAVCGYSNGAIIGSAFIDMMAASNNLSEDIVRFIKRIKEPT